MLFLGLQDIFSNFKKGDCIINLFVISNFKYCPIIWMFCGKGANNKINKIHKRALRVLLMTVMHHLLIFLLETMKKLSMNV